MESLKSKNSPINLYLLSIVITMIGSIIRLQLDSQLIGNTFRIIGFFILMYSILKQLLNKDKPKLTFWMRFLLYWNTINILYTAISSGINATRLLGEESYLLSFMLPYLLLYDVRSLNIKKLFSYSFIFILFALVIIASNYEYIIMANNLNYILNVIDNTDGIASFAQIPIMWSIPAAILFMNINFVKNKYLIVTIIAYILAISFSMTFGRRSTSAYGVIFLLIGGWMFMKNPEFSPRTKFSFTIIFITLTLVASFYAVNKFSYLLERGLEDSRSGVVDAFHDDMEIHEYVIGRGLNGVYYDELNVFDKSNNLRTSIETGYLNIILHAGCLFLVPYIIICLYSAYCGYRKSKNSLIKSFAIYILLNTLMLYIGSYPGFNLRFFILWVGILLCNNNQMLSMTNKEIKEYFKLSK